MFIRTTVLRKAKRAPTPAIFCAGFTVEISWFLARRGYSSFVKKYLQGTAIRNRNGILHSMQLAGLSPQRLRSELRAE